MAKYDTGLTIDERELLKFFDNLSVKISDETLMKALTIGGMDLRDHARQRLLTKMPKAATAHGREEKYTMEEGVQVHKETGGKPVVNVYILGNYLNRWFELGTDERLLRKTRRAGKERFRTFKKGESRGKIKPIGFFNEAVENDMKSAVDKITGYITKIIDNEYNK